MYKEESIKALEVLVGKIVEHDARIRRAVLQRLTNDRWFIPTGVFSREIWFPWNDGTYKLRPSKTEGWVWAEATRRYQAYKAFRQAYNAAA